MKKLLLLPFIGFPYFLIAQHSPPKKLSPEGYEINIQMRPFKNQMIYLAHYFGNEYPIVDSALLNGRSEAVFKGGK